MNETILNTSVIAIKADGQQLWFSKDWSRDRNLNVISEGL